jgi:oligopeptide/dipeptide ABC transporter ATP-binding protein
MTDRATSASTGPLLVVEGLTVDFGTDDGVVHAVIDVSLSVDPGEIVAIVGESGSGKTVTAMSVLGLIREPPGRTVAGSVRFQGRELRGLSPRELRTVRGGPVGMIFQDPMTTFNPVMTIGAQIIEAIGLHQAVTKAAARERAAELLRLVGVSDAEQRLRQYPHEFSGGMRQRAMIAMAIANDPSLIIADEPTTALDVTIQAQVLALIKRAQEETGAATIIITHDLGVVAELADRVLVMYAGRVVEIAEVRDLFARPRHPYTAGLLASLPRVDVETDTLRPIPGNPPNMVSPPDGCAFHPRCPLARDRCRAEPPALLEVGPARWSACHYQEELADTDGRLIFESARSE